MTDQPDQPAEDEDDDMQADAEGAAFDAGVKTENNTGGFKPGRDDPVEEN